MTKEVFEESRDRVLTGIKRKINKQTLNRLIQTAVHESGHALACYLDEICKENIHKVTIIPRGTSSSKSYTLSNDSIQGTKEEMYSFIDKSLGGIFAEEIFFDDKNKIGSGCEGGDLERATSLAKSMIKNYGMKGSEFGLQVINDSNYIVDHKISQETRDELDKVVLSVINERSAIVKKKLKDNSHLLKLLTKNLIQYEELSKEDIEKIFSGKDLHKQIKNQEVLNYMEMNEKKKVI
jgi:ATP-dependent Zn protease